MRKKGRPTATPPRLHQSRIASWYRMILWLLVGLAFLGVYVGSCRAAAPLPVRNTRTEPKAAGPAKGSDASDCPLKFSDPGCPDEELKVDLLSELHVNEARCIGELNLDHATFKGDLHLKGVKVRTLSMRGAAMKAITLEHSCVDKVELESAEVKGTLAIESSHVGEVLISHSKLDVLEIRKADTSKDKSHVKKLSMTSIDVELVLVQGSQLDEFDLTRVRGMQIHLDDSQWKKGELIDTSTQLLSVAGSSGAGTLTLGRSTIQQLDLGDRTAEQVQWTGGLLGALRHEKGVDGVLDNLRGQAEHNKPAFAALEKDLRDEGERLDANRVHTHAIADGSAGWKYVRLLYLDGHGHPLAYLALLAALVAFGASFFSSRGSNERAYPDHVQPVDGPAPIWKATLQKGGHYRIGPDGPDEEKRPAEPRTPADPSGVSDGYADKRQEQQKPPHYSAFVMSLATLLPGDTLNYLRNYRFVPRSLIQAVGVTILQAAALGTEGLLLASILSLLGR